MSSLAARPAYHRLMTQCRLILRHADGRVDETSVFGEGPIEMESYFRQPDHTEHWWKVVALRWGRDGGPGVAELEPATLPPELEKLEA